MIDLTSPSGVVHLGWYGTLSTERCNELERDTKNSYVDSQLVLAFPLRRRRWCWPHCHDRACYLFHGPDRNRRRLHHIGAMRGPYPMRNYMRILMWVPGLFWLYPCGGGLGVSSLVTVWHGLYTAAQLVGGIVCSILIICECVRVIL